MLAPAGRMGNDGSGTSFSGIAGGPRNLCGRAGGNMEKALALPLLFGTGLVPILYGEEAGGVIGQPKDVEPDVTKFASGERGGERISGEDDTMNFLFETVLLLTSSCSAIESFTSVLDDDDEWRFCGMDISMTKVG